jgi:hypothetical protein
VGPPGPSNLDPSLLPDAPTDGLIYGRSNAGWVALLDDGVFS